MDRMASLSFPQPQRTSSLMIPQTPRTQMIQSHLEQKFELMKDLQQKNQEQAQLQTGLQAFLKQSMEQMFYSMAPPQTAPPPQASSAPHIVSITPVSALPQPAKMEEPMDSAPSQPPLEVKKGLSGVKGSSAIALQSIHAVASNITVPTSAASSQPTQQPTVAPPPRLQSPLQALEQEKNTLSSSFAASRSEEPSDTGEQAAPPNLPFRELVQKADRPPFIKLPMVADLSCLLSTQDDLVKPSTSSTLDIGKFPGIPPHKGSWYSIVDAKYSQTPQVDPQLQYNKKTL